MPDECEISVGERRTVARRFAPRGELGWTLVLAHGAGAGQRHPFLVRHAEALSARGLEVVTFDFLYTHEGRRVPDHATKLEACWRAVIGEVSGANRGAPRRALPGEDARSSGQVRGERRLAIGGKSMGGRYASMVAAAGVEGVEALVFLGYPLHPPGKPEQLRAAHLPSIAQPMLFVQGERDEFGTPDELRPILAGFARAELFVVEGGDHSLGVRKAQQAAIDEAVQSKIVDFLTRL
jgi:predicted alpha/beta-hydrolase family hydrolase